jgi:hypothetical protein
VASPTGIIPELLMDPRRKKDVIAWLKAQPAEAKLKKSLLLGWATVVGIRLQQRDYREVAESAIDR